MGFRVGLIQQLSEELKDGNFCYLYALDFTLSESFILKLVSLMMTVPDFTGAHHAL